MMTKYRVTVHEQNTIVYEIDQNIFRSIERKLSEIN